MHIDPDQHPPEQHNRHRLVNPVMFRLSWKLHRDDDRDQRLAHTFRRGHRNDTGLCPGHQSNGRDNECWSSWNFHDHRDVQSRIHRNRHPRHQRLPCHRFELHSVSDERYPRKLRHLHTVLQRIRRQLYCDRNRHQRISVALCNRGLHRPGLRLGYQSIKCHRRRWYRWTFDDHHNGHSGLRWSRCPSHNCFAQYRVGLHSHADERYRLRNFHTLLHRKCRSIHCQRRWDQQ